MKTGTDASERSTRKGTAEAAGRTNAAACIRVVGARDHNLKNVSVTLPRNALICFTGVSGSGKSTLAFDTLYAEGQRRYVESLSSYARQFMGQLPKPDVDHITGLSPAISIQQKTSGWNPRSTVGTITQIHDYLRVLYARAGTPHCTSCGRPIAAQTREQMIGRILALPAGTRFNLLAPKVRGQKGEYRELFGELTRAGFVRARVDGAVIDLASPPALDRYRRHDIEVVVDRLVIRPGIRPRLADALDTALAAGEGTVIVQVLNGGGEGVGAEAAGATAAPARAGAESARRARADAATASRGGSTAGDILLSARYACAPCGLSFEPPSPQMLSFNSPQGMCPRCDGMGWTVDFDPELLVPDPRRSFLSPCIAAFRSPPGKWRRHIYEGVARHVGFDLNAPWGELPETARRALLYGTGDAHVTFEWRSRHGVWKHGGKFEGVIAELSAKYRRATSAMVRSFYERFMRRSACAGCGGARLSAEALAIRLEGEWGGNAKRRALNIHEACRLSIREAEEFFGGLVLSPTQRIIAEEPLKEIRARLRFLIDVGLDYLTLDRTAPTLSGGESQRIRLASQIGCGLTGVLYVLDEPSIGLHPRDNRRLLRSLCRLRDMGNTVIVVEHDRDTMLAADRIVDFGPGPGVRGGRIVACGSVEDLSAQPESVTGAYLARRTEIPIPQRRRPVRAAVAGASGSSGGRGRRGRRGD